MFQNIKINHTKRFDSKLYSGHYYDYMLYKGEVMTQTLDDINGMAIADFSTLNIIDGRLYSTVTWSDAVCRDVELNDIGLTGVDNGFISYDKDKISNKEFLDIFLHSQFKIEDDDTRLFFSPVTGNTKKYEYPMYLVDDDNEQYIACKGGFYQGFFKLEGFEYQVLPDVMTQDIVLHFEIRPRSDYEESDKSVNALHPENKGIFFYMGTRAENKFWPLYGALSSTTCNIREDSSIDSYFTNCDGFVDDYLVKSCIPQQLKYWLDDESGCTNCQQDDSGDDSEDDDSDSYLNIPFDTQFLNRYDFFPDEYCGCCGKNIFVVDTSEPEVCTMKAINEEYLMEDVQIPSFKDMSDSEGHELGKRGYYELSESDNKYLMFDRTKSGFTTSNWVEGTTVKLTGRKHFPDVNYFLIMNRTETGFTVSDIEDYYGYTEKDFNIYKDIRNNVFALRITDEGAIGYRYGVLDCSGDTTEKYKVVEEYSKNGMVKTDEWNSINIRFAISNPTLDKCDKRNRRMRIMFYVNGFLKFISRELDALHFKALDEVKEKQESVPYNISLGGGSIGLLETITPDYYLTSQYILPIERDFCGTFIGDIRSFVIYRGFMPYSSIKNYL